MKDLEEFEDFMRRHGYEDGEPETMEEVIYWTSVFNYENKLNWRRQIGRIRKILDTYKNLNNNER